MISLLHRENSKMVNVIGIEHLNFDEFLKNVFCDNRTRQYVKGILSNPLACQNDIIYRQEIIKTFFSNQHIFIKIYNIYNRFELLNSEWIDVKRKYTSLQRQHRNDMGVGYAKWSYLKNSIQYLLKVDLLLSKHLELLEQIECKECLGLSILKDFILQITQLIDQYMTLINSVKDASYENISAAIGVELNETIEVMNIMLLDCLYNKHSNKISLPQHELNGIFNEAINQTNRMIVMVNDSLFNIFCKLKEEMQFYNFTLRYMTFLYDSKLPSCFPVVLSPNEQTIKVNNLYDIFMTFENEIEKIVVRDIDLSKGKSSVIIGDNNTGKTYYLRSIAYVQILSQAGLPIPAKTVQVSIRNNIFITFSSTEMVETNSAMDIGLFERDVQNVSQVVYTAGVNDLVLFNEVFQATFYDEAADALKEILNNFQKRHIQFAIVTHITKLLDTIDYNNLCLLKTHGDFHLSLIDDVNLYNIRF